MRELRSFMSYKFQGSSSVKIPELVCWLIARFGLLKLLGFHDFEVRAFIVFVLSRLES